jgi:hypothetical protein
MLSLEVGHGFGRMWEGRDTHLSWDRSILRRPTHVLRFIGRGEGNGDTKRAEEAKDGVRAREVRL